MVMFAYVEPSHRELDKLEDMLDEEYEQISIRSDSKVLEAAYEVLTSMEDALAALDEMGVK
jgi:hypothetical protein